jgi:hypothetical protein
MTPKLQAILGNLKQELADLYGDRLCPMFARLEQHALR